MAKLRRNYLKKQRKPIKVILVKILKGLFYLIIILSFASSIYLINNSKLFEPSITWEIRGDFEALTNQDNEIKNSSIINKYFVETITHQYDDLIKSVLENKYLIELSQINENVEKHPWVSKANAERIFWNKIRVTVENHDIAMQWGSEGFISSKGILFQPRFLISSDAPIGIVSEDNIEQFYIDFKKYQATLGSLKIARFERSAIDQLILENNIKVILGYQKQSERLDLFIKVYKNFKKCKKDGPTCIFDMRYPRDFAFSYSPL